MTALWTMLPLFTSSMREARRAIIFGVAFCALAVVSRKNRARLRKITRFGGMTLAICVPQIFAHVVFHRLILTIVRHPERKRRSQGVRYRSRRTRCSQFNREASGNAHRQSAGNLMRMPCHLVVARRFGGPSTPLRMTILISLLAMQRDSLIKSAP